MLFSSKNSASDRNGRLKSIGTTMMRWPVLSLPCKLKVEATCGGYDQTLDRSPRAEHLFCCIEQTVNYSNSYRWSDDSQPHRINMVSSCIDFECNCQTYRSPRKSLLVPGPLNRCYIVLSTCPTFFSETVL